MSLDNIKEAMQGRPHLQIYKNFIRNYGIKKAILLSTYISVDKSNAMRGHYNGWFKYYESQIMEDTGFGIKKIKAAKKDLIKNKILFRKVMGDPSEDGMGRTFYKVNYEKLINDNDVHSDTNIVVNQNMAFYTLDKELLHVFGETQAMIITLMTDKEEFNNKHYPWFYAKYEYHRKELGVSYTSIEKTIRRIKKLGLIKVKQHGYKRENWYKFVPPSQFIDILTCQLTNSPNVPKKTDWGIPEKTDWGIPEKTDSNTRKDYNIRSQENHKNSSYEESNDFVRPSGLNSKDSSSKKSKKANRTKFPQKANNTHRTKENTPNNKRGKILQIRKNSDEGELCSSNGGSGQRRYNQMSKDSLQKKAPKPLFDDQTTKHVRYANKENLRVFRYWNEQPNLTRHKKNTKTFQQCLELIQAMRTGTLIDKVNIKNFNGNGVAIDDLSKKWTPKEIRKVIKIINEQHKVGYWPENKTYVPKNLANAIYNPRTGKSWFLMVHKFGLKELQKPQDNLSDQLKSIYDKMETTLKTLRCQDDISKYTNGLIEVSKDMEKYYNGLAHHKLKQISDIFYTKFGSAISMTSKYKTFLLEGEHDFKEYRSITPKGLGPQGNLFKFFIKEWEEYLGISFSKGGPLYEE